MLTVFYHVKTRKGDKARISASLFLNEERSSSIYFIISLLGPLSFLIKCSLMAFYASQEDCKEQNCLYRKDMKISFWQKLGLLQESKALSVCLGLCMYICVEIYIFKDYSVLQVYCERSAALFCNCAIWCVLM